MEREQLIDVLLDLQHDLGKYILLPLSFLPREATPAEVRAALRRALFETHKGPSGVRSAREIWTEFETTMTGALGGYQSFAPVCASVERALAWEAIARDDSPVDRDAANADLAAVVPAVRNLIDEVNRDR